MVFGPQSLMKRTLVEVVPQTSSFQLMVFCRIASHPPAFQLTVAVCRVDCQTVNACPIRGIQVQCVEERGKRRGSTRIEFEELSVSTDEQLVGHLVQGDGREKLSTGNGIFANQGLNNGFVNMRSNERGAEGMTSFGYTS